MNHTTDRWANGFINALDAATKLGAQLNYIQVGEGSAKRLLGLRADFVKLNEMEVVRSYSHCTKRVILLDYDGTLTPADTGAAAATKVLSPVTKAARTIPAPASPSSAPSSPTSSSSSSSAAPGSPTSSSAASASLSPSSSSASSHSSRPSASLLSLLSSLCSNPDNCVFIMSGRTRSVLTDWFGSIPELGLAAEKGLFLRWPARLAPSCRQNIIQRRHNGGREDGEEEEDGEDYENGDIEEGDEEGDEEEDGEDGEGGGGLQRGSSIRHSHSRSRSRRSSSSVYSENGVNRSVHVSDDDWEYMASLDDVNWKRIAFDIIRNYTEQTDGTWIEDKEFAIVWHYENADPEYGRMQASDLQKYLIKVLANPAVDCTRYDNSRILEVKPHGVGKGQAATAICEALFMPHFHSATTASSSSSSSSSSSPSHSPSQSYRFLRQHSEPPLQSHNQPDSPSSFPPPPPPCDFLNCSTPFFLVVGDDRSDEEMFLAIQTKAWTQGKIRGQLREQEMRRSVTVPYTAGVRQTVQSAHSHQHDASGGIESGYGSFAVSSAAGGSGAAAGSGSFPTPSVSDDLFMGKRVSPHTYTVTVGMKPSHAQYYLLNDIEVVQVLQHIVDEAGHTQQEQEQQQRRQQ